MMEASLRESPGECAGDCAGAQGGTMTDRKSEMEKMLAGEWFFNSGEEINGAKKHCRGLCSAYNRTSEEEPETRRKILKEIFGTCGDDIFIKPPFYCDYGFNLHVGKKFFVNFDCVFLDVAEIRIGDNCLIGPQCGIYTAVHHRDPELRARDYMTGRPVRIGNNVWIGGHVTILPGVTIGDNVIIGAGSVVTRDIPDHVVAAGNPARVLHENICTEEKPEE